MGREHKKAILQENKGQFTITLPIWLVKKVLCAKGGDKIGFDFRGSEVTLKKL